MGTTTNLYQSLHSRVVEIVGIIAKRIVELNGHQLQPHKAVREQENDKTVCHNTAVVGNHDKGNGVDIQKEEGPAHLNQWEGNRLDETNICCIVANSGVSKEQ
jgi:hypothetical protein